MTRTSIYRPVAGYLVRVDAPARPRASGWVIALSWTAGFVAGAIVALLAH